MRKRRMLLGVTLLLVILALGFFIGKKYLVATTPDYKKWENSVWVTLGDSITWQDGKEWKAKGTGIAKGYQTLMKLPLSIKEIRNIGQYGEPMTGNTVGSTTVIGKNKDYKDVQVVTIFAGTNDLKQNKPIGTSSKKGSQFDTTNFYGAYQSLIEEILRKNPEVKIYLWTPLKRNDDKYNIYYSNALGYKLIDYVNAIKDIGKMYGIPVLDLYADSGIDEKNISTYTLDGLHPNDAGYKLIADKAMEFIGKKNE